MPPILSKILKKSSYLLAGGASLIIGLLSFSGMFALLPLWPVALAVLGLAVAYEFEIFGQNIKGSFDKLFFVKNYLENYLAKEFLRENFPKQSETACPFFEDYLNLTRELAKFEHKDLDKEAKNKKRVLENSLRQLEQVFRRELFSKGKAKGDELYPGLRAWIDAKIQDKKDKKEEDPNDTLKSRKQLFRVFMVLGLASAAFMTLGTTFLLSEALAAIPFLTAVAASMPPAALILMAVVAGVSYGFLTYNAVTDMVNNKTLQKFKNDLVLGWKEGWTTRNVLKAVGTFFLVSLAVALTLCTAGTWWTVAKEATPLFNWLTKIPEFVMGVINPIVAGFSALFFNLENTHATLKLIEGTKKSPWAWMKDAFAELKTLLITLPERENLWQMANIPRIILTLCIAPLRCLLFLAHLLSIAVSGDRLPGIPEIITTMVGFFAEGFEDAHYFIPHDDHAEHVDYPEIMEKIPLERAAKTFLYKTILDKVKKGFVLTAEELSYKTLLDKVKRGALSIEEQESLHKTRKEYKDLLAKAKRPLNETEQTLFDETKLNYDTLLARSRQNPLNPEELASLEKQEQALLNKALLEKVISDKIQKGSRDDLTADERTYNSLSTKAILSEDEQREYTAAKDTLFKNKVLLNGVKQDLLDDENQDLIHDRLSPAHGHSHDNDFPTMVLKFCFIPIYALAILWDLVAAALFNPSKTTENAAGRHKLSLSEAIGRQTGHVHEHYESEVDEPKITISMDSQKAIARLSIEEYQEEHFGTIERNQKNVAAKKEDLQTLKVNLEPVKSSADLSNEIMACADLKTITTNRHLFWGTTKKTSTSKFLTHLADDFNEFEASPTIVSTAA